MFMKILIATTNKGKMKEFGEGLSGYDLLTLNDVGFDSEIEEDGTTYIENAQIKAKTVSEKYPEYYVLGDDSGTEFEVFGFENHFPGLFSHRWKSNLSNNERNQFILDEIKKKSKELGRVPYRANYFCTLSLYKNGEEVFNTQSIWKGEVLREEQIGRGFGYDSIITTDYKTSIDCMPLQEKNKISHRGQALFNLKRFLNELNGESVKVVNSVSLYNDNNYKLTDISDDELESSVAVLFSVDSEFNSSSNNNQILKLLEKTKRYIRVPIEDIDINGDSFEDKEELSQIYNLTKEQAGGFEFPNKQRLSEVLDFIEGEDNVIVACSAGVARSGALATFLVDNGYELNPNYNTRFAPNEVILEIFKEIKSENNKN